MPSNCRLRPQPAFSTRAADKVVQVTDTADVVLRIQEDSNLGHRSPYFVNTTERESPTSTDSDSDDDFSGVIRALKTADELARHREKTQFQNTLYQKQAFTTSTPEGMKGANSQSHEDFAESSMMSSRLMGLAPIEEIPVEGDYLQSESVRFENGSRQSDTTNINIDQQSEETAVFNLDEITDSALKGQYDEYIACDETSKSKTGYAEISPSSLSNKRSYFDIAPNTVSHGLHPSAMNPTQTKSPPYVNIEPQQIQTKCYDGANISLYATVPGNTSESSASYINIDSALLSPTQERNFQTGRRHQQQDNVPVQDEQNISLDELQEMLMKF